MVSAEWRESFDVGVVDLVPGLSEVVEGGLGVDGVPEGDGVDDEAEGRELVFLAFSVALPELAFVTVEYGSG